MFRRGPLRVRFDPPPVRHAGPGDHVAVGLAVTAERAGTLSGRAVLTAIHRHPDASRQVWLTRRHASTAHRHDLSTAVLDPRPVDAGEHAVALTLRVPTDALPTSLGPLVVQHVLTVWTGLDGERQRRKVWPVEVRTGPGPHGVDEQRDGVAPWEVSAEVGATLRPGVLRGTARVASRGEAAEVEVTVRLERLLHVAGIDTEPEVQWRVGKDVARGVALAAGEVVAVPFSFNLPEALPVTVLAPTASQTWRVVVTARGRGGARTHAAGVNVYSGS